MKVLLYLGGSKGSMSCRVDELQKIWAEGENPDEIYAGFDYEIHYMRDITKRRGIGARSYDTVSNIRRKIWTLKRAEKIIISTGPYHWETINKIIVPKKFPELKGKLVWLNSGENEGLSGKIRRDLYYILGPTFMEWLAIMTRPWKYLTQYRIPMMWDNFCLYILNVDAIDCIE